MPLKELSIGAREGILNGKAFNKEVNSIATFYFRKLPKITIENLNKLSIILMTKGDTLAFYPNDKYNKVCSFNRNFDFDNYFNLDYLNRKKKILEVIIDSIREISKILHWDIKPFEETYRALIDTELELVYKITKSTRSNSEKNKGYLEVEFYSEYAQVRLVLTDANDGILDKIEIIKTQPHEMYIFRIIQDGKWRSSTEYLTNNAAGDINFSIDIDNKKVNLLLNPGHRSKEDLLYDLTVSSAFGDDNQKLEDIQKRINQLLQH